MWTGALFNYVMTDAHMGDMLRDEGYKASWLIT